MPTASLTRTVEFPAGHRYAGPDDDEAAARERFGKSAVPHGHNYRCEVTVSGEMDPETGMVVELEELDRLLRRRVVEPMDHAFLNELPEFADGGGLPTTENLARAIWERLETGLPAGCRLVRVRVAEDSRLWADYTGE